MCIWPLSPPSRGAWIEISRTASTLSASDRSPPSRGAWIEIVMLCTGRICSGVAPLAGGVD